MRFLLPLLLCAALASQAKADAILKLTSGATTVTIADNSAADFDGTAGIVQYNSGISGPIGVFNIQITVGSTKPAVGSETAPVMDLFNVSINSMGSGTLTIEFTDHDFQTISPAMGVYMNVGGTTQGSVTTSVKADDGNTGFGGSTVGSLGPFGAGAFSGSGGSALVGFSGTYSLTLVGTVTHSAAGQISSFDLEVTVPEPSSLAFLGSALGMIFLRRRRRRS